MLLFRKSIRSAALAATAALAAASLQNPLMAQQAEETVVRNHITVTDADRQAAANVRYSAFHVTAAGIPGAKERAAAINRKNAREMAEIFGKDDLAETARKSISVPTGTHFYPADLSKATGPTMTTGTIHALYVDYSGTILSNWGNPEGFLRDLFSDPFIHLSDQYTGASASFTVGKNASVNYTFYGNVLGEHDIWAIVHAAAKLSGFGSGLSQMYHVFLPKGIDICFDESADCYSPDNFDTWTFCGFHDAVNFGKSDPVGTVLFTVQPYQNVDGCADAPPYPNGKLADSTNSVLSHETFETITDPLPPSGWTAESSLDEEGYEVADECQPLTDDNGDFLVPIFKINEKSYKVQLEYSNTYHACAAQP